MASWSGDASHPDKEIQKPYKNVQYWISDLRVLAEHPPLAQTVCIVGVVVAVITPGDFEQSRRPIGYQVDDGTGVIKVVQFLQKRVRAQNEEGHCERLSRSRKDLAAASSILAPDLRQGLESLARRTGEMLEASRGEFAVGSCVEARGRLQHFRDQPELLAFSVRGVEPVDEVERMIRTAEMKRVYPNSLFSKCKK